MSRYQQIHELDQTIAHELGNEQYSTEEIQLLVDKRETMLKSALAEIRQQPHLASSHDWQALVQSTETLVRQMEQVTRQAGLALHRHRQGLKSVQQYKKFL